MKTWAHFVYIMNNQSHCPYPQFRKSLEWYYAVISTGVLLILISESFLAIQFIFYNQIYWEISQIQLINE